MRTWQWGVGLCMILLIACPAWAEFYRYVDEHGNVLFTDDLSKVPVEQRAGVQSYESSQSLSSRPPEAEQPASPQASEQNAQEQERKQLQTRQDALNKEYEDLMAERTRLNEEKSQAVTTEQIKAYNARIVDFNTRIQAYEEKRDALARQMEAYNERMQQQAQNSSAPKP